jgi:hypothetical protein
VIVPNPAENPTSTLAIAAARAATGRTPMEVRRFRTGAAHYVFEAVFGADRSAIVVRMGTPKLRAGMAAGVRLNRVLRQLGVPLPEVLAEGLGEPFPWVALERLPGTDLGHVIGVLSRGQLGCIADGVAGAQAAAAKIGSGGRYGYAARPEAAPHARWSSVLEANLTRSRMRISAAGLFGLKPVDEVAALIAARQDELDATPATAFLHDTTTRNVIVTSAGTLSGIVDVDDLCFGDPRYAPALTLAVLCARGGPVGYVESWMRAADQCDDVLFRLYVALFLVDLMGEHGQRFNGNERASSPRARDKLLGHSRRRHAARGLPEKHAVGGGLLPSVFAVVAMTGLRAVLLRPIRT